MASARDVPLVKADPPEEAAYQLMAVPVAVRLATVADPQKLWLDAVGADGIEFIVTVTAVLVVDSHPFSVWVA